MTEYNLNRRRLLRLTAGSGTGAILGGIGTQAAAATDTDGVLEWSFKTGNFVNSSPTVVDGTVYIGSYDNNVYAIDAVSGDQKWSFTTGDFIVSSPMMVEGTVYIGSASTNVYAIDATSGDKEWSFNTGDFVNSSPMVVGGTVYVGSWDGNLFALDAASGDQKWSFTTGGMVDASPTVVDNTVYVSSWDNNVYALDAASGDQKWSFNTFSNVTSSPTVVDGTLYTGSNDGTIHAIDASNGNQEWSFNTGDMAKSSPTVADGTVYIGSDDGHVYAIDAASGDQDWRSKVGGSVETSPTVVASTVFIGGFNVYALDAASGDQKWSFNTDDIVESSPTVVDGTVYVGSHDSNVYAINTGVDGSSEGSRVLLGTLGHHHELTGRGSIDTPKASIILDGSRPVQTITNTRNTATTDGAEPDPPLVAGDNASIAFGLKTQGLDDLPNDAEVTISISATGTTVENSEFSLTKPQLKAIAGAKDPILELAQVFAGNKSPPVFTATSGLESVTITVESKKTDSYEIDGSRIILQADNGDFEVSKTPTLNVGIARIDAPVIGTNPDGSDEYVYGKIGEGTIVYDEAINNEDEYDSSKGAIVSFASDLLEYLQSEYPTADVEVKIASETVQGTILGTEDSVCQDYSDAYEVVYDEYPHMDVALAVVPDAHSKEVNGTEYENPGYYEYHNDSGTLGSEHWDSSDNQFLQPQEAAGVLWQPNDLATVETAAQEIAHHFLSWSAYSGSYTFDGNHVVPDEGEFKGVRSTGLTVGPQTYEASKGLYSFMSYSNFYTNDVVTDARTHQKLINSDFKPHPPETAGEYFDRLLQGFVNTAEVMIDALAFKDGNPLPDVEEGDVTVRVKDGAGDLLAERETSRIRTTHHGEGKVLDVAQFIVPYTETAATVEFETAETTTTIDPVSGTLSEMVSTLRANAFKNNPEERRNALQEKLDAVGEQMAADDYRGAANTLENDILDKLQEWLVKTDPEAANVPSKQDVIDQCKEMIDHVQTLAEEFGNGR